MALFKILKGNSNNLVSYDNAEVVNGKIPFPALDSGKTLFTTADSTPITEGYAYFTEDTHKFYIDTKDKRLNLYTDHADYATYDENGRNLAELSEVSYENIDDAGSKIGTININGIEHNVTCPTNIISKPINKYVFTAKANQNTFTIPFDFDDSSALTLYYNGIMLKETDHYTGMWAWKHQHHDGKLEYIELKGHIELENVNFGYEENKTILHDITLYAKPGQKIAFVGATGAGKTTITNLLNRFYDINDGKIRYDGININKIRKEDLRKSLGMVLQDVNLFTGTIRENIRYGNENASDEEVIEAAKLANAHNFITHLPQGYDTMIDGNGGSLSQGQKQLISIARAALNNPPVMILDEATSSIDTRTEKIVQDGMDKLMEGRTVFVIAHRLSTVRNSKAIIVLDHGEIIERGNHEDLIAQKGVYYRLYAGGFELE